MKRREVRRSIRMNCRIGTFENVYIDRRHFLVALELKACPSMRFWCFIVWLSGGVRKTDVNINGKRAFFRCFVPWNRCWTCETSGKSFEWEAGKAIKKGVYIITANTARVR